MKERPAFELQKALLMSFTMYHIFNGMVFYIYAPPLPALKLYVAPRMTLWDHTVTRPACEPPQPT